MEEGNEKEEEEEKEGEEIEGKVERKKAQTENER